jgi:hypothetical protein
VLTHEGSAHSQCLLLDTELEWSIYEDTELEWSIYEELTRPSKTLTA